jgi:hypothetical protein
MSNPFLYGKVEDGQIYLEDINLYHRLVHELEGRRIEILIDEMSLSKTEKQRNTYYGIIIRKYMMNSEIFGGWTVQECDDYLGYKFRISIKSIRLKNTDKYIDREYMIPIHKLNRKAMAGYIDQCIAYLQTELGIEIEIDSEK